METENKDTKVESSEQVDQDALFGARMNELCSKLEHINKETKNLIGEVRLLKKDHDKIVRKSMGTRRKKVRDPNAPKRPLSGFAVPTVLSPELLKFIGEPEGTEVARPVVTKKICAYIKEKNLAKEDDKTQIDLTRPGGKELADLLGVPVDTNLTYFNIQTYLKSHYPQKKEAKKKEPKKKAASAPAEVPVEAAPAPVSSEPATEEPKKKVVVRKKKVAAEPVAVEATA